MASTQAVKADHLASTLGAGVMGGVLGGVLIDSFLVIANHMPIVSIWQFVASAVVGGAAFTSPAYAALGAVVHFVTSIVWGVIFALLAGAMPGLLRRPVLSGIVYGIGVMLAMTTLLIVKHLGPAGPPDPAMLIKSLIAHTAFFGVPVSLFVAAVLNRR